VFQHAVYVTYSGPYG